MRVVLADTFAGTLEARAAAHAAPPFEIAFPDGSTFRHGGADSPACRFDLTTSAGVDAFTSFDELRLGEAYLRGDVDVTYGFGAAFRLRPMFSDRHPWLSLWRFLRPALVGQSRQNLELIPDHYDESPEFYTSFLDERYHLYSQAVFEEPDNSLEEAAENKLHYVATACEFSQRTHVLDVGGGWGSLARRALAADARVTLLTVSPEQARYLSEALVRKHPEQLDVTLEDFFRYRPDKQFDAVTFLGSMEHLPDYGKVARRVSALLRPGGFAYMDFSAIKEKHAISSFTYRHVFKGNGTPVFLPELLDAMIARGFDVLAVINDTENYHLTTRAWAERLESRRCELVSRFGEAQYRLFRLYLWATAYSLGVDRSLDAYRVVFRKPHNP